MHNWTVEQAKRHDFLDSFITSSTYVRVWAWTRARAWAMWNYFGHRHDKLHFTSAQSETMDLPICLLLLLFISVTIVWQTQLDFGCELSILQHNLFFFSIVLSLWLDSDNLRKSTIKFLNTEYYPHIVCIERNIVSDVQLKRDSQ